MEYRKLSRLSIAIGILIFSMWYLCGYGMQQLINLKEPTVKVVENMWRKQARSDLQDLKRLMQADIEARTLNVNAIDQLYSWSKRNVSMRRIGGVQSDFFIIQMPNMKIAWDRRYVTDANIGKFRAENYEKYKHAELLAMREAYNTDESMNHRWIDKNGNPELLEWVFVPSPDFTYFDTVENSFKCAIIVARISGKEIQDPFLSLQDLHKKIVIAQILITLFAFIIGVSVIIYMWRVIEHRMKCDKG